MPDLTSSRYVRPVFLKLAAAALPLIVLSSCGGYGGSSYSGGGGGATCGGAYGTPCPAPTVMLTAPSAGATVSKMVTLSATASAASSYNVTVNHVDFMVDGAMVGTAMAAPYSVSWDSTKVANGSRSITAKVTDSVNGTATSSATVVTVQNMAVLSATMTSAEMFPAPASGATGTAHLQVNLETGAATGTVTLSGIEATAVGINEAFAGAQGPALFALTRHGAGATEWDVPSGALLTAEQLGSLGQGKLYVIASSARHPNGEIRGQLVPESIVVTFSELTASPAARALGMTAGGIAATTVDADSGTVTVHLNVRGVDDAMAAQLLGAAGAGGAPLAALVKDSVDMGHWSTELAGLSAADVAAFRAGQWSVRVATPTLPEGAVDAPIGARRSGPSD
jgi:CHRD domain/Bacterial Ig domain